MNKTKKYIHGLLKALAIGILLTSCDAHIEFPDTNMQPCRILCTDGKVVTIDQCEAQGRSPIGVVFYINQGGSEEHEGTGYAVYLWDIAPEMFADSLGVKQNTSASLTKYDGNGNTFAIYNTRDMGAPLADAVFAIWRYGQSAYIPSVAQMQLLYRAKASVNAYIKRCGGDPIPDEPDKCWYWTSTEVSGQESAKAWLYSLSSGAMQETPKDQAHKARPIITLYQ